ncbi:MAG: SDR family NAD(P)-dependent oxidoreductase, partial [Legionella sp.]|nr:SDR family NAD(P)-dependent oxidoreductase [Legionella sp.]
MTQIKASHHLLKHEFIQSKVWFNTLEPHHPVIKNHKVYGQRWLPGLAWIDLIYQWFLEIGYSYNNVELRNFAIYRPCIVKENDPVHLKIEALKIDNFWRVSVSNEHQPSENKYVSAEIHLGPAVLFDDVISIDSMIHNNPFAMSIDKLYEHYLNNEVVHTGFMKSRGIIFQSENVILMQLNVNKEALSHHPDYLFHPALLDAAGLCCLKMVLKSLKIKEELYLPVFYESFKAELPFTETCFVYVNMDSCSKRGEIVTLNMDFFNEDGRKIAQIQNLKNKLARDELMMNSRSSTPFNNEQPLKTFIRSLIASKLKTATENIDTAAGFYEMGLDSVALLEIVQALENQLSISFPPTLLFEYTSIDILLNHLEKEHHMSLKEKDAITMDSLKSNPLNLKNKHMPQLNKIPSHVSLAEFSLSEEMNQSNRDIAVIGMSGRYPMAKNLQDFWDNLLKAKDCIIEIPDNRWNIKDYCNVKSSSGRAISNWGGFIEDIDCFDARFFRISPKEAENIDPQERLFLEICWEAIEDAGYTPSTITSGENDDSRRPVGVFVGVMHKDYTFLQAEAADAGEKIQLSLNYASIANRVSFFCNFHGPSLAVDTVCSSSLTALHLAIESILSGESKVALVGGVNLSIHPNKYLTYGMMDMHSTDGRCRSFGKDGDGYVSSEGVGALLIKPLAKAIADGDNIYAVIKGTSINHGGQVSGLTVPSPVAQAQLIADCIRKTNISPETIHYMEAHGTGTSLGDPIEIEGLKRAFAQFTDRKQFCALGSVKSNIGHAEAAAGISGLTKTILQLYHAILVKTLHSDIENPYLDLKNSPFYIQSETEDWKKSTNGTPRRAGVSSFGASGSNAHVILEEAPERAFAVDNKPYYLITISAKTEASFRQNQQKILHWLIQETNTNKRAALSSISFTLNVGRTHFNHRGAWIVSNQQQLIEKLELSLACKPSDDCFISVVGQNGNKENDLIDKKILKEATHSLYLFVENKKLYHEHLQVLAHMYAKGYAIDWELLHQDEFQQRVSLPTYAFEKQSYWTPIKNKNSKRSTVAGEDCEDLAHKKTPHAHSPQPDNTLFCFEEKWQPSSVVPADNETLLELKTLICFISHKDNQQAIIDKLQTVHPNIHLIFIAEGKTYEKITPNNYVVIAHDDTGYEQCFKSIKSDYGMADGIWYAWGIEDSKYLNDVSPILTILQTMEATQLNPSRVLLAGVFENGLQRCHLESWIGFERSLKQVVSNVKLTVVIQEHEVARSSSKQIPHWTDNLWNEFLSQEHTSALYQRNQRSVLRIFPCHLVGDMNEVDSETPSINDARKTYLITGGLGGLGCIFAKHLAKKKNINLILTGRSPLTAEKQGIIDLLQAMGSVVYYLQTDVCNKNDMMKGIVDATKILGPISGVIHAAGLESDGSILTKNITSFQDILNPKIQGTMILDDVLSSQPLELICYFSSSAAVLGDFGSCDYAVGNRFQMAYAEYRNGLEQIGKCKGRTIVMNWPLWREGGMGHGSYEQTRFYLKSSGQRLLETQEGLELFDLMLTRNNTQCLVLAGQSQRINQFLGLNPTTIYPPIPLKKELTIKRAEPMQDRNIKQRLLDDLKEQVRQLLKMPTNECIDTHDNFADFGFDSISLAEFARLLNATYAIDVRPSLFFGHSTLAKLSDYFLTEFVSSIEHFYNKMNDNHEAIEPVDKALFEKNNTDTKTQVTRIKQPVAAPIQDLLEPIAIIGISGRFPCANTIEEFWNNIEHGLNCISEFPQDRLSWQTSEDDLMDGHLWGGFLNEIDQFDPLFFDISPQEAECMDPRQRLFLEEAWHAFEDAGYMGERIRGKACGVYVGVEEGDYENLQGNQNSYINSNHNATIAARIAYALDLKGPNLALTSACSSGLVAIHQACLALRQNDCEMALVGGIHLLTSTKGYRKLNHAGMLSPSGQCHVFDDRANGLVPGEAVAVVLLKRLSQAILDKDNIYGCITASGVNYDGKTNGITAPNYLSQVDLIKTTYDRFQIDPSGIQYIIAHSVGSKLGDPVEFEAFTKAFNQYTDNKQYCALGSIKPQFGHSFAASGIVNLITMVLAMKNQIIPATCQYEIGNEFINLKESQFFINNRNQIWFTKEGQSKVGAISSTGISGTNAHLVIQSYNHTPKVVLPTAHTIEPNLIVFSARNEDRLFAIVNIMIPFIESKKDMSLSNLAYTLQVGREEMHERLAIIAFSIQDLLQKLQSFVLSYSVDNESAFRGKDEKTKGHDIVQIEQNKKLMQQALSERNLKNIALLWVKGTAVSWNTLSENQATILSLPTYPFIRRRCWIDLHPNVNSDSKSMDIEQDDYKDGVAELYTLMAEGVSKNFDEDYLTFCPFAEKIPGFSMTRIFANPELYPKEVQLIRTKQIEMRQVLFCNEAFEKITTVLDFGCGYGTDVIQIAELYPHIKTHGFTITPAQAELGNRRILQKNLKGRANIFCKDSTKEAFPMSYDLAIGIEVSCHIHDKDNLFRNISRSLKSGGRLLLADFIANLRGPIVDSKVAISISTQQDWIDILTKNHLAIDEIIDVSPQIANFQFDPDYKDHIKNLPKIVSDSYQNYANNAIALEKGWVSYCLFKMSKSEVEEQELRQHNQNKITHLLSYPDSLEKMLKRGDISYPKLLGKEISAAALGSCALPLTCNGLSAESGASLNKSSVTLNTADKPQYVDNKHTLDYLKLKLTTLFARVLKFKPEEMKEIDVLQKLGISSLNSIEILESINTEFDLKLPSSTIFQYNTLEDLAKFLKTCIPKPLLTPSVSQAIPINPQKQKSTPGSESPSHTNDIAIIGIACRCAGANQPDELWDMIKQGRNSIQEVTNQEWIDFFKSNSPKSTPFRYGRMTDIESFDPLFFNILPKEAALMDAMQRIILQESYKSLEDAGYSPSQLKGQQVGTFIGVMGSAGNNTDLSHYSMLGSETSILAARLAYFLDLKGPALAINTACSSSLVAMDLACQQLKSGDIHLAIAGGITLYNHPELFVSMNNAGLLSPTGECRPFDDGADGIVVGDGVGIVVLKRLQDALSDNDRIYGVIRGIGTNQDGQTSGITVPSFLSQSQLQQSIYKKNQIDVEEIQYIETHGTATKLGDPVEIHALNNSFGQSTQKKEFCAIGSLKANIGHTTAAAGVLGVIKVLLSLKHGKIPPSIHYSQPNKHIDFASSPFYVNTTLKAWLPNTKGSRIAAISSFGFSGTNAHVIIEEGPKAAAVSRSMPHYLITLSAKTAMAFKEKQQDLLNWLKDDGKARDRLSSISYTLNTGRSHFNHRGAWIVEDKADLQEQLSLSLEHKTSEGIFIGVIDSNKKPDDEAIYENVLTDILLRLKTIGQQDRESYYKTLRTLGNLYVKGYGIDWELLYQDEIKQRISLPTYPFAKEPHRVPVASPKYYPDITAQNTTAAAKLTLGFYKPEWEAATLIDTDPIQLGQLLIFGDDARLIDEIARFFKLQEPNINLIRVQSSTSYQCLSAAHYAIRPGIKADYEALLADVTKLYPKVAKTYVVDLWSEGAFWKDGELQLAKGIFHLLILSQVLLAYKVSKVRLLHMYAYKDYQLSLEEMNSGFMKTLQEEHPDFFYQLIGFDDHSSSTMQLGQLIKNELNQGLDTQVRYIKNARLVHRLKSC